MSHIDNTTSLIEGLRIGSQTPVDDRLIFSDLADLINYGVDDHNCYRYYEGIRVWVLSEAKEYIWREVIGSEIGEGTDFTYPSGHKIKTISYGTRVFNFFETGYVGIVPGSITSKVVFDTFFSANTSAKINHNLGTTDIIVQIKNNLGELVLPGLVDDYQLNEVHITLSIEGTFRVIIIG